MTHIPRETLDRKLEGILEIYEKFCGVDPRKEPMKVFPAMHYTMGGIWVNGEDQATSVPGIYAAGECEYQYHGANRGQIRWCPAFLEAGWPARQR